MKRSTTHAMWPDSWDQGVIGPPFINCWGLGLRLILVRHDVERRKCWVLSMIQRNSMLLACFYVSRYR